MQNAADSLCRARLQRRAFLGLRWTMRAVVLMLGVGGCLLAGTVRGSKHDLSNPGTPGSDQVCMFCHTPHYANNTLGPASVPLWNRYVDTSIVFTVYSSRTLINQSGNPSKTGSAACLGCHDGSIGNATVYGTSNDDKHALINGANGLEDGSYSENCVKCHSKHGVGLPNTLKLGKDLRNMHPIAITYPTAAQSSKFIPPTDAKSGWSDVKLYNGSVECGSCHAVHDPTNAPFLRKSNDGSALCLSCHIK